MPGTRLYHRTVDSPPTFVLTFSKHLEEQRGPLIMGKSLTIQQGSAAQIIWVLRGKRLQGPQSLCMQKEEMMRTDGWRRRTTDLNRRFERERAEREIERQRWGRETMIEMKKWDREERAGSGEKREHARGRRDRAGREREGGETRERLQRAEDSDPWNRKMRVREREERANILGALFRRLPETQQEDTYKEEEDIHL